MLFIIFLLLFYIPNCLTLKCYDGYGDIETLGIISCLSQYCVSGILEDGTRYHTCPSNSYCTWGSGCMRTKEAGEIFACCCDTDYCNESYSYLKINYLIILILIFIILFK
uniref:Activin_recp domain-containing protein n=1 Tax=Parastrongyloides trichosuri TaxID=131310 RepID=A0A0N4ZEQ1_PARTI